MIASTSFGKPLLEAQATLRSIGPKEEFKMHGAAMLFEKVPAGLYELEVQASGFNTHSESISLYSADATYRVGLSVAEPPEPNRAKLSGLVTPLPGDAKDIWVRLVGIYSGELIESQVSRSGKFSIEGLSPGSYILLLFREGALLDFEPVEFVSRDQKININLKSKSRDVPEPRGERK